MILIFLNQKLKLLYTQKFATLEEGLVQVQKKILNYGNWHHAMRDCW